MTALIWPCADLEVREAGRTLTGSFPYGKLATLAATGSVRKERFAARAFAYSVDGPGRDREVNLLAGHSFNAPLASRGAGTLKLRDSDAALTFEARLPPDDLRPSWMRDAILAVRAGLFAGLSPGFRVPPASAVPNAERLVPEPGNPEVSIREILQAVLLELSLVTRPAYQDSSLDLRSEWAQERENGDFGGGSAVCGPEPRRVWL